MDTTCAKHFVHHQYRKWREEGKCDRHTTILHIFIGNKSMSSAVGAQLVSRTLLISFFASLWASSIEASGEAISLCLVLC